MKGDPGRAVLADANGKRDEVLVFLAKRSRGCCCFGECPKALHGGWLGVTKHSKRTLDCFHECLM